MKFRAEIENRRIYCAIISLIALSCGGKALAQTNAVPTAGTPSPTSSTNIVNLGATTVVGHVDTARNLIRPDLGTVAYTMNKTQLESVSQGDNAPFNQVILRAPGVAQDSAANGDLHVRGEHANLQYRVNDILLPEGISGFGIELDPRFVESMQLITGALPAQYGYRTAGVVDIHTKTGGLENGGEVSMYGGSYDTIRPSFEIGGVEGAWNYFADGSYDHNNIGIENPTPSSTPIHDTTDQYKSFIYASKIIDDTSSLTAMASVSYAQYQVPNTPNLPVGTAPGGADWNSTAGPATFNSSDLNERQNEQNYFGIVAYQKSQGALNLQVALFGRASSVHFMPDEVGDLYFNGVASDVDRKLYSGGLETDASYDLGEKNTLRGGFMVLGESLTADTSTTVFDLNAGNNPAGGPRTIVDNSDQDDVFYGVYLEDEWKILPKVTLNFGGRFDLFQSSFDNENQVSPRASLVYQPTDSTTLHIGYSRYFTPPPLENLSSADVDEFSGTSNASSVTNGINSVKAERADYYDVGISQKLAPGLQVGVDAYYKRAKNQLDDGLFGQTLILSAFNYARGEVEGVELTGSYTKGGFSLYANVAFSSAKGEDWNSAQFLFDQNQLNYVKNHWVYLDHDQTLTGSYGTSYLWNESARCSTRLYVDALTGSGLRADGGGTIPGGEDVPNGSTVGPYYSVNLGAEQSVKLHGKQALKARVDVVNVTDHIYELRNGSGIGVNAAQYGERLGIFGSFSFVF